MHGHATTNPLSIMTRVYSHRFTVPAEAIDVNRHANNIEYLRWMQDVAMAHSAAVGWPMERYLEENCSWVIRSHFIEYLRPALLDDPLNLLTWVADMKDRSSNRKFLFFRESDRKIIARAETAWVFVDVRAGLPRHITEAVRTAFEIVGDEAEALALTEAH